MCAIGRSELPSRPAPTGTILARLLQVVSDGVVAAPADCGRERLR